MALLLKTALFSYYLKKNLLHEVLSPSLLFINPSI